MSEQSITDQIRAVLQKHPLIVGEDFYAGELICDGCHIVTSDMTEHLTRALAEALDPFYAPSEPHRATNPVRADRDPRESQIVWYTSEEGQ